MARPKKIDPKKQFTVMLKPSVVDEIDRIAKKLDLSRSQLMANLIQSGLDDAKVLEKMGMLDLIRMGSKIASKLRIDFLSGKTEPEEFER
jgi:metal-responsive CopG/Arc/MetJ family transcriptional regulator